MYYFSFIFPGMMIPLQQLVSLTDLVLYFLVLRLFKYLFSYNLPSAKL